MKLAFVVPRFAKSIAGGAETLVAELAMRASQRKHSATILTTCAIDNRTWENYFEAGTTIELGLPVHRFTVSERDLESWVPKQISISEGMNLSLEDQLDWLEHSVNSSGLYQYIINNKNNYDYFLFAPYLSGTTFWGSLIAPEKSILIPCLHDESYAYTDCIGFMFQEVRGCLFNAEAEQALASQLYGKIPGAVVGMGFTPHSNEYIASLKPYFQEDFPYVLYVGRKETGKNVQVLIDCFLKYKEVYGGNLKLVIAGGGSFSDLARDEVLTRTDVIDVEHVSEFDKHRLIKHARFLCQPSTNESFSIVLMEAWLLGTPVVINSNCAVTREYVVKASGELYFSDIEDFCEVAKKLVDDPELALVFGRQGYDYVVSEYSWEAVLDRFDQAINYIHDKESTDPGISREA